MTKVTLDKISLLVFSAIIYIMFFSAIIYIMFFLTGLSAGGDIRKAEKVELEQKLCQLKQYEYCTKEILHKIIITKNNKK